VHPVALLSFFIPSVMMFLCLISLHYLDGINKVMMMMMMMNSDCSGNVSSMTKSGVVGRNPVVGSNCDNQTSALNNLGGYLRRICLSKDYGA